MQQKHKKPSFAGGDLAVRVNPTTRQSVAHPVTGAN